jgi:uncharacterized protein (DUF58 family)
VTTRGRTLAVLALASLAFGRVVGLRELVMAGSAFALLLCVGAALVWLRGGQVEVRRTVHPSRTSVGHPVRIELVVEASGRLGGGPALVSDRLPAAVGATRRLALEPADGSKGRGRAVAYTVSPRMRGRHQIGPVELTHTDPLASVQRNIPAPGTSTLVVYPSYEEVSVLPAGGQRIGILRRSPALGAGDEFYSLRSYEEGDDLRKIHWPSTFKSGELVVRQDELLADPRALLVLDTSASKHKGRGPKSSLEAAVSACASVGVLAMRKRMRLDVVTTDGPLLPARPTDTHELLEALACVKASAKPTILPALKGSMGVGVRPSLVVVITPRLNRDETTAAATISQGASASALVWVDASSFEGTKPSRAPAMRGLGIPVVRLRAGESFRAAWHTGVRNVALAR